MTTVDIIIFLIAGIIGALGGSVTVSARALNLAWVVIVVWCILKLIHVL